MVLSYSTSPAYHIVVDGTDKYRAASFDEGHYMQVEVAAMLKSAPQPELAAKFMDFILDDGVPVRDPNDQLDVSGGQGRASRGVCRPDHAVSVPPLHAGGRGGQQICLGQRAAARAQPINSWRRPGPIAPIGLGVAAGLLGLAGAAMVALLMVAGDTAGPPSMAA